MEYLVAAEECAKRFSALARDGEGADGDLDGHGDEAFPKLLAAVYVEMGAVERSRNATTKAASFALRAMELDPDHREAVNAILSKLSKNAGEESTPDEHNQQLSEGTESTGKDVGEEESSSKDTEDGGNILE